MPTFLTLSGSNAPTSGNVTTCGNSREPYLRTRQKTTVTKHWKHVTNKGASLSPMEEPPRRYLLTNTIDIDTTLQEKSKCINFHTKFKIIMAMYCIRLQSQPSHTYT